MSTTTIDENDRFKRAREPARVAYSAAEAAQRLGLSEASIWRAIKRGEFKAAKIGGRTLIAADQVDGLFDAPA